MAWVRIHDAALTHPKLTGLVSLTHPFTLWIWGLSYCQTHLTDGAIPKAAVPKASRRAVEVLLDRMLWECDESGYRVHHYLDWNDSRDLVTKRRSEARTRMQIARERPSDVRANSAPRTSHEVLRGSIKRSKEPITEISEGEFEGKQKLTASFQRFYAAFPRQEGAKAAADIWALIAPNEALVSEILSAIERQKKLPQWQDPQFIPSPKRYLEEARWTDALPSVPGPSWSLEICTHDPRCGNWWKCDLISKLSEAREKRKQAAS